MNKNEIVNSIKNLVEVYNDNFVELSISIVNENVSNYPIFVFQKDEMNILGKQILKKSNHPEEWNVYISHLEELYHKKVIEKDKIEEFQFRYKENNDKFCVLSIPSPESIDFVFIPKVFN